MEGEGGLRLAGEVAPLQDQRALDRVLLGVEPVLFGTNFVPVHPNALGESKMAEQTMSVLNLR